MVHNQRLAPPPSPGARLLCAFRNGCIQEQVVDLVAANLVQHLLRKRLDSLQVGKLQRQDRHRVARAVIGERVIGGNSALGVSSPQEHLVRLGLLRKELFDSFKALIVGSDI
jgi:hypothetical protein